MKPLELISTARLWTFTAGAVIALLLCGCHPWQADALPLSGDKSEVKPKLDRDIEPRKSPESLNGGALADDQWTRPPLTDTELLRDYPAPSGAVRVKERLKTYPPPPGNLSDGDRSPWRWRNPAIEKAVANGLSKEQLWRAINSDNPVLSTNAAIVLGRQGEAAAITPLERAIRSTKLSSAQRCAAAEALALVPQRDGIERFRRLLDDLSGATGDSPEVALCAALLRGLGKVESSAILSDTETAFKQSRFAQGLASRSADVRREALVALADRRLSADEGSLMRLVGDANLQVRKAALLTCAARGDLDEDPPVAHVLDTEPAAQSIVAAALGLAGKRALARLVEQAESKNESERIEAVCALADARIDEVLESAATDRSWRVRQVVAAALADRHSPAAERIARRLAADGNAQVGCQAIEALAKWPPERALPALVEAIASSAYLPRKMAAEQIEARWPEVGLIDFDAVQETRVALARKLMRRWDLPAPITDGEKQAPRPGSPWVDDAEALPLIEQLNVRDCVRRRQALQSLVQHCVGRRLSDSALEQVKKMEVGETDPVAWTCLFELIGDETRPPAAELAAAALSHTAPVVRQRGCCYFADHPNPNYDLAISAALSDSDSRVVYAAAQALGQCRAAREFARLEQLLTSEDHSLRVRAALTLAQLDAPSGPPALVRLAYDKDDVARLATARAMGTAPNVAYLPELARLLDDRPEIRHAALDSLPRVAALLKDAPPLPAESGLEPDRAEAWRKWLAKLDGAD